MSSADRVARLRSGFRDRFGEEPQLLVQSPARAEIIGCHTDYNHGWALGCALSQSILAAFALRGDHQVCAVSADAEADAAESDAAFDLTSLDPSAFSGPHWSRYLAGVADEIQRLNPSCTSYPGLNIYIESSIPMVGGLSSSAALEAAIAFGLLSLWDVALDRKQMALLCQRAENGPFVGVPCGILDQASVLLSDQDHFVLLDFDPALTEGFSATLVPAQLCAADLSLLVTIDPAVQRRLGESGYAQRRASCEASLPVLSAALQRPITSLRDVQVDEFLAHRGALMEVSSEMAARVEHVVHENQRVAAAVEALAEERFEVLGELLNQSGESALSLYGLSEGTPELDFLLNEARADECVLGTRNMGGGFSAVTLTLIGRSHLANFKERLSRKYQSAFNRELLFIDFQPGPAANVVRPHIG